MKQCAVCGNLYDKTFEVIKGGESFLFDSFECAIQKLAPRCDSCGITVLGHGVEANGIFFCCAHCARQKGTTELKDRPSEERRSA